MLGEGCRALGPSCVSVRRGKTLTGAEERYCAASAGLPNSALGSAPGLTVLALISSGERGSHPRAPEIGCEYHSPCSASHPAVIFPL